MDRLYGQLCRYTSLDWRKALERLAPEIHPIDRNATSIWFAFYPLDLHLRLDAADDRPALERRLGLQGVWRLAEQVDSSHRFLYAHRFWAQVRAAMSAMAVFPDELAALITSVAHAASRTARVDRDRLTGMAAVGLMTLRQAGVAAFAAAPGRVLISDAARLRTPTQMSRRRARDDWQGLFGFMRGLKTRWTVTFDENEPKARFPVINGQEIATAAGADKREYHARDPRCTPGEGPIPVQCRAASCGTCWIGVLGGAEKLSPVVERDEGRRMKVFGYIDTTESQPLIRLACQAKAEGAVSIVIPPWNGVFGT